MTVSRIQRMTGQQGAEDDWSVGYMSTGYGG